MLKTLLTGSIVGLFGAGAILAVLSVINMSGVLGPDTLFEYDIVAALLFAAVSAGIGTILLRLIIKK